MSALIKRKILVAVDGSKQAFEVVRYVSHVLPPALTEVVLFYVATKVPESFWDSEKAPAYQYRIIDIGTWEKKQEQLVLDFMASSRQTFSIAGFPEDAVTVRIQDRKVGIAQDIVEESRNGYDAIALGRNGLSDLKDFMLGNIAQKVVERVSHVPVWVIGGKARPQRILIGMDNSPGAGLALGHVAVMLNGAAGFEVILYHAIRGFSILQKVYGDSLVPNDEKELRLKVQEELDLVAKALKPTFDEARCRLVSAGLSADRIHTKITTGVSSRAAAIVEEAERSDCDTIVVGRRGMSKVQEFFMGRISTKVLHLAKEKTVWVAS